MGRSPAGRGWFWGGIGVWALVVPLAVGADAVTLEAAVARALDRNVTYQTALLTVAQADAVRTGLVDWKDITVSATQKTASSDGGKTTASVGLSLPVFDQLGATVSVDQDQSTSVAVTATPLAHSTASTQLDLTYRKALLAAEEARITLVTGTKKAWLAQAVAQAQADAQARETALKQTAYLDAKAQFDHGTVTLAEVRTALKAWTDARTTQSTLEQTLTKAQAALAALLQSEVVTLAPVTVAEVKAWVEGLGPLVPSAPELSNAVRAQGLEVANQQAKADALWWVDPQLSVTGTAVVPAGGATTWSGAVTLSLALGDVAVGDRLLADRAVALAQAALEAQKTSVRSAQAQSVLALQAASAAVESRTLALTQAQELEKETEIQARAGLATALDLDEAQLGVTTAENDLLAAWVDAFGARLDAYW